MSKRKLSFSSKVLILDNVLCRIFSIFTGIFLSAYFYSISEEYVFQLALYNLVGWIVATLGAIFLSDIIKRKDKIWFYRMGIIVKMIFVFTILILGPNITDHIISLGILCGLMVATNGYPFNMIESENVTNSERISYIGYGDAMTGIVSIIAPLIIGRYITSTSYISAAIPIVVLVVIELAISFFLKSKNKTSKKLNTKAFLRKHWSDKTLRKLYYIEFLKGLNRNGVMGLVASLIIISALPNDTEIGNWQSFFSVSFVVIMFIFARYYKKSHQTVVVLFSTLLTIISTIMMLLWSSFFSIIFYNLIYETFLLVVIKITRTNLLNYSNKGEYKTRFNTEYFTIRELFLNAGRMIGYLALVILAFFGTVSESLNIMFIIIIISIIIMSGLILRTKTD